MPDDDFNKLMNTLGRIHRRINEIADLESRDALVRGWASSGALMPEKMRLVEEADRLLAKAMAPASKTKKKPDVDAVTNAVRVARIATGEASHAAKPAKKASKKKR